jgi:hypothetical protein
VPTRRHEPVRNATVFFVHGRGPLLARFHEKARSPVLAPTLFPLLGTLRALFSIVQNGDAARLNTLCDEIIHRGLCPPLPEIDVELILPPRGPPIVAMPFDQYEMLWIGAQPRGARVQDPGRIAPHQISSWASTANMVLTLLSIVSPGMIWTNLVSIMVFPYAI